MWYSEGVNDADSGYPPKLTSGSLSDISPVGLLWGATKGGVHGGECVVSLPVWHHPGDRAATVTSIGGGQAVRILHLVTRSGIGGAQTVIASLAEASSHWGHEVLVASGPEGGGSAWTELDTRVERVEVPSLVRRVDPQLDVRALLAIRALYLRWRPDIVHLHTSKAAALGRLAPGVPRDRIVYTMHGYQQLSVANRKLLPVDRALRRRSAAIVAVSHSDAREMRADGYRAMVIPNGCADVRLMPGPGTEVADAIAAVRLRGLPVVMMIARDAVPKRVDLARAAARHLQGRAEVVWIGGSPAKGDPANFTALESGHAASCLQMADVFLLLSDHEGMPAALLEAMSAGLPSVVSAVDGCLETLGVGAPGSAEAGIAVPNELDAITRELAALCEDLPRRVTMGARARRRWDEAFTLHRMASDYTALYTHLVGGDDAAGMAKPQAPVEVVAGSGLVLDLRDGARSVPSPRTEPAGTVVGPHRGVDDFDEPPARHPSRSAAQ